LAYIRGKAQILTIPVLQAQIGDLLKERASLKRTIAALSNQVQALNAVPVNTRKPAAVCGTSSGYQKHIREKEKPCYPCKAARAEYTRNYRKLTAACG
jgi:hypothetical protein